MIPIVTLAIYSVLKRVCVPVLTAGALLSLGGCQEPQAPQNAGGLAALAASAEGFAQAVPETRLAFPRDHGAHDAYRIEWWYLTANLEDESGQPYGAQWTLFRIAQRSEDEQSSFKNPWQDSQVYMAHFAISTPDEHHAFQRYARGGSHGGQARAGVAPVPFRAWLDDWYLGSTAPRDVGSPGAQAWLPLEVRARQDGFSMRLMLTSDQELVLQGDAGFSRKHPDGGGSHYYSHPFLAAEGELTIAGKPVSVRGQAWLDREWSSQFLQGDQSGWDWFALHLDSGEKLMLFRLREADSERANYRHGVLISPTGEKRGLDPGAIQFDVMERTSIRGRKIPTRWRVMLRELDRELIVSALHPEQWMNLDFPYWEGYVRASGTSPGESGRGYLEMVGYTNAGQ